MHARMCVRKEEGEEGEEGEGGLSKRTCARVSARVQMHAMRVCLHVGIFCTYSVRMHLHARACACMRIYLRDCICGCLPKNRPGMAICYMLHSCAPPSVEGHIERLSALTQTQHACLRLSTQCGARVGATARARANARRSVPSWQRWIGEASSRGARSRERPARS
jgi:hypothetical protein